MAWIPVAKRTRGPNKQTPWARKPEDGVSVLRLALDAGDPVQRRRIEAMFAAGYQIRRALQRGARDRCRAYDAARHERQRDAAATRARLGLTRDALEHAAYGHLDATPHLRRFATKALAMHLADSVWTGVERHLFRDARGGRQGRPHVGRWFDFTRLPGRARSHTTERKWETFRLQGTLAGHRAAYRDADGDFYQPRRLRDVEPTGSWWDHTGPLAVVFSGLADGTLVLPVRLPAAPSNQPILDHHLADPAAWHKIDLVRNRDPKADGGWRYEAHLMVLTTPYVSASTVARRSDALQAANRVAGIDVNVSNVTVASHVHGDDLQITRIERDGGAKARAVRQARRARRRLRALDRSRRAQNVAQYQLSKRQEKRAQRREAAGLAALQVVPAGPRLARTDGIPLQAYRKDALSATYRRERAAQAADAESVTQARRDHARRLAGDVVRTHGYRFVVEDCNIGAWARLWGRSIAAFAPGMLLAAITREAAAVAVLAKATGGVVRASTATALSQHCLCGARVAKSLAIRVHVCAACGLVADRDAMAATLASCVVLADAANPGSAELDGEACQRLRYRVRTRQILLETVSNQGRQDVLSESNALTARDGSFVPGWWRTPDAVVVARRIVGMASPPTPNEPGACQTTSDRMRMRTYLPHSRAARSTRLRDSS
jgi:hypothetical protein